MPLAPSETKPPTGLPTGWTPNSPDPGILAGPPDILTGLTGLATNGFAEIGTVSGDAFGSARDAVNYQTLQVYAPHGFGDGSDGSVVIDGTNTFAAFATTTGVAPNLVYTLTRDVFAADFTVSAGITLNTAGYRILCTYSAEVDGTVTNSGAAAAGTTAGAAGVGGTLGGGGAGAAGLASNTTTVAGNAASNTAAGYHNIGGRGGAGGNAGGAAGTLQAIARVVAFRDAVTAQTLRWVPAAVACTSVPGAVVVACGGTGGGGGARTTGGTAAAAGAGGGGGGGVFIAAPQMLVTATGAIRADGGAGSNATGGTCVTGGGGGGGGGFVVILYCTLEVDAGGTITAAAGANGSGINGAAAPGAVAAGVVYEIKVSG